MLLFLPTLISFLAGISASPTTGNSTLNLFKRAETCPSNPYLPDERIECADRNTTPEDCVKKSCCFDVLPQEVHGPYCFFPKRNVQPSTCPATPLPSHLREECAEATTSADECTSRGCCWSVLAPGSSYPNCYKPATPSIKTEKTNNALTTQTSPSYIASVLIFVGAITFF